MKKVLIAEDDVITQRMVQKCIDALGHASILSSNGRRAWEVLCDNPDISLLITDISMPDMDGRALIQSVRADAKLSNTPIIIISGVVGPKEISNLLELGASRFLAKPLQMNILKEYAERYLEDED